jgi:hypothetical protein
MTFEITVASADDVQRMARWAADEGWNPGNTDAYAFHTADPGAFLIGRLDGEPVTCISVVKYGQGFGFLGFYIARPAARGKGYGLKTWDAGMVRMAGRNVGLDGVPAQQANYRKSGFRLAWNNIRYEARRPSGKAPAGVSLLDARSVPFDRLAAFDRRFFLEPRDSFLAAWITLPRDARPWVALRDGKLAGFAVMRSCQNDVARRTAVCRLAGYRHRAGLGAGDEDGCRGGWRSTCRTSTSPGVALVEAAGHEAIVSRPRAWYTGANPELDYAGPVRCDQLRAR